MTKLFLLLILELSFQTIAHANNSRVRHVEIKGDQIVSVKTSLGVATIIQVPDRPNSVVVGDQEGFRVEYLDQAITIKPVRLGARSNLYIYTDLKRYNVELVTGSEATADYVVYLNNPKPKDTTVKWMNFSNHLKSDDLRFNIKRLGKTGSGPLFIEFEVMAEQVKKFEPEWLWITQEGNTRPIHNLLFNEIKLKKDSPIKGVIHLLSSDVDPSKPIRVELRRKKLSYLTIPKASSWK